MGWDLASNGSLNVAYPLLVYRTYICLLIYMFKIVINIVMGLNVKLGSQEFFQNSYLKMCF